MGSKSKTEKSVKEEEKKMKKKKTMALAPISKPKKLSKRTVKLVREEDISTKEKKEKKRTKLGGEKKKTKLGGKKKRKELNGSEDDGMGCMSLATESRQVETQTKIESSAEPQVTDKSERAAKKKKKDRLLSKNSKPVNKSNEAVADEVYHISSGDENSSKGMKKWLTEYHQSRPGLDILQQKIDEFIAAHEEREEQARQEREARAAEGGWTVVVHHKGRKKTTDSESGITVGSVAQAAVVDKMAKKKSKEVGIDFYRFQRREAQRNEVMMLQSKFEQDRKRIQQLRAARKFKPY